MSSIGKCLKIYFSESFSGIWELYHIIYILQHVRDKLRQTNSKIYAQGCKELFTSKECKTIVTQSVGNYHLYEIHSTSLI